MTMFVFEDNTATGAMPVLVACIATWDYGNIQALGAAYNHVWAHGPTTARVYTNVHVFILSGFYRTNREVECQTRILGLVICWS